MIRKPFVFFLSVFTLLLVWQGAAFFVSADVLPGPLSVAGVMGREAAEGTLFIDIGITLARVAVTFVIAMVVGSAIGIGLGLWRAGDRFFDVWLIAALNLPALVVMVLCYIWFGLTEVAAIAAVAVNKIPLVAVTLRQGTRALDRQWSEVADLYQFGRWRTLRHVILPQLAPYFAASARTGLALIWKIVLVVELLGRPNGVGFQIQTFFQLWDIAALLAYAIAFMIVIQLIESVIIGPWEQRVSRWRGV